MSDQGMDMLMNQNRGGVIPIVPIIGIIMTILLFYFAYKFYRDESKMSFVEKVKYLKRLVKIVLILFVSVLVICIFIMVIVILMSLTMGMLLPAIILLLTAVVMAGAILYLYYLIYKEYKVLVDNFEQEKIFVDENVVAFKQIAKISMWILFISLASSLMAYLLALFIEAFMMANTELIMNPQIQFNLNAELNVNAIIQFIICIILNILAVIFEKAVKLYKENNADAVV